MRLMIFAVALATVVSTAARAEDTTGPMPLGNTVYLGMGGLYSEADATSSYNLAPSGGGLSAMAGWRILPYLGLEGSYEQWSTSRDAAPGYHNASTIRTLAGDLYGYWPMGRRGWFQPFVTIGLGATGMKAREIHSYETPALDSLGPPILNTDGTPKMDGHRDVLAITSPSSTHLRVGGGIEWTMFNDHLAGRITGRYQPYRLEDVTDHGTSVSFALLVRL